MRRINAMISRSEKPDTDDTMQKWANPITIIIYTDASGIENNISTVIYNLGANKMMHQHLGEVLKYKSFIEHENRHCCRFAESPST